MFKKALGLFMSQGEQRGRRVPAKSDSRPAETYRGARRNREFGRKSVGNTKGGEFPRHGKEYYRT